MPLKDKQVSQARSGLESTLPEEPGTSVIGVNKKQTGQAPTGNPQTLWTSDGLGFSICALGIIIHPHLLYSEQMCCRNQVLCS